MKILLILTCTCTAVFNLEILVKFEQKNCLFTWTILGGNCAQIFKVNCCFVMKIPTFRVRL